jgi:SAM-dependent methyltransferase
MNTSEKEYILGTGDDELHRLGVQHRVWSEHTHNAWLRAGVKAGARVLDLGCGPGHASIDLAKLVTSSGQVTGIDASPGFVEHINRYATEHSLYHLQARIGDAEHLLSPKEPFDVVYCRWVLCWLKNPESALQGIRRVLKPGGTLLIHDYFNWKSMTSGPRSFAIETMVQAAVASFEERHGDVDISARLPKMLGDAGFSVLHISVNQMIARGGGLDPALQWPLTWWRSYGRKLVSQNKLDAAVYEKAEADLSLIEKDADRFFFCPPLFEFIAHPR